VTEKNINFQLILEPIPLIYLDPDKLHQTIMNLVKNAIEALEGGGNLTLTTKQDIEKNRVKLIISDNGVGMDHETLENLGTPFFTTKDSGTGLGMMTSFRIIEEMGGSMTVESEKGKGTTFNIVFPIRACSKST
jgi:signal transduction histidine kinase